MSLVIEDTTSFTIAFEPVTECSPTDARAWLATCLTAIPGHPEPEATVFLAMLAASELVTNVLRHALGAARLTLKLLPGWIEVAAADQFPGGIRPDYAALDSAEAECHRGLAMLEQATGTEVQVRAAEGWAKEIAVRIPEDLDG